MNSHIRLLFAVLALVTTPAVHADRDHTERGLVLVSPSLVAGIAGNLLECRIVNLSPTNQPVTITSYDSNGALVGSNTINVPEGAWSGVSLPFENGPSAGYCKFSIPGGERPRDFRASISIFRLGFGIIAALPAD
jgi:hypothetical protein